MRNRSPQRRRGTFLGIWDFEFGISSAVICCAGLLLLSCRARSRDPATPLPPASDTLIFREAETSREAGDFASAEARFRDLLASFPESPHTPSALFWLAFSETARGGDRAALTTLGRLIARFPDSPFSEAGWLLAYGIHLRGAAERDLDSAREDLETLLARFPNGRFADEARAGLALHIEAGGDSTRAAAGLAQARLRLIGGHPQEALAALSAISFADEAALSEVDQMAGVALALLSRADEAETHFRRVLAATPDPETRSAAQESLRLLGQVK